MLPLLLKSSVRDAAPPLSRTLRPYLLSSCCGGGGVRHQHAQRAAPAPAADPVLPVVTNTTTSANTSSSRLDIDSWGAVSSIPDNDPVPHLRTNTAAAGASATTQPQGVYSNHDGLRIDDGRYKHFLEDAGVWRASQHAMQLFENENAHHSLLTNTQQVWLSPAHQ